MFVALLVLVCAGQARVLKRVDQVGMELRPATTVTANGTFAVGLLTNRPGTVFSEPPRDTVAVYMPLAHMLARQLQL